MLEEETRRFEPEHGEGRPVQAEDLCFHFNERQELRGVKNGRSKTSSGKNRGSRIKQLVSLAMEKGAYRAKSFSARLVAVDERVRLKCQIPLCPHYGQCLTCPPNVPTVEEFRAALKLYSTAVMVQTRTPLTMEMDDFDKKETVRFLESSGSFNTAKGGERTEAEVNFDNVKLSSVRLHKLVNEVEGSAIALGFPYALGLIGGDCMLCSKCVGLNSGTACRRPYQARPSMEGVGIDVVKTSISAGLPFAIPPKTEIIWSGLVLVD
jgi:predicted metal-binding protein